MSTGPFHLKLAGGWASAGGLRLRGSAALDGEPQNANVLARRLEGLSVNAATLRRMNGGFAVVSLSEGSLVAAVDRLRTVPLFYGQHGGQLYISDDAHWVADQLPPEPFDDVRSAEFLVLGYVTGPDTLRRDVKQLQAGELLAAEAGPNGVSISTQRYFTYAQGDYFSESFEEVLDRWDVTFRSVMERVVVSAAGRTIAVPLSGGWDSRLILLELKRLGYDRVQCFTYGVRGSSEAEVSRAVAGQLGYPWECVPYSREKWRRWHDAPEFNEYARYADNLCSVPHIQDWPAVWELRRAGRMPDDAIFAPGHNGGFLCSESLGNLHRMPRPTVLDIVRDIERVHYINWRLQDPDLNRRMRARLVEAVGDLGDPTPESAASAFERWEWQERQAKFISNAVRVYEFWGFDWRMPFWDAEALAFWERMPLGYRARERLHRAYLARAAMRERLTAPAADRRRVLRARFMRDCVPERAKRAARDLRRYTYRRNYERHVMGWYGIIDLDSFRRVYRGTETINTFLALERLRQLEQRAR